jgi:hypothetical protein
MVITMHSRTYQETQGHSTSMHTSHTSGTSQYLKESNDLVEIYVISFNNLTIFSDWRFSD